MTDIDLLLKKFSTTLANKNALIALNQLKCVKKISYKELWERVEKVKNYFNNPQFLKSPVLLYFSDSIEFIIAFLGCILGGAIAVPVKIGSAENFERELEFLKIIASNSNAVLLLTDSEEKKFLASNFIPITIITKLNNNSISIDANQNKLARVDGVCCIQYTSGSTAAPKGAIINYDNIIQNILSTSIALKYQESSKTFNWVPHTHVYGLICGLLTPLYNGNTIYYTHTKEVISNPLNWLNAISFYEITHSGSPDFGYRMCNSINLTKDQNLNLSCWEVAVNGGDVVLSKTLIDFINKFGVYGFSKSSFYPAYGMSEATGAISSRMADANICVINKDVDLLELDKSFNNTDNLVVSCGSAVKGTKILIIDTENSNSPVSQGNIGEIWISGKSVSSGYWMNKEATNDSTYTLINENGEEEKYFKTGDLGLMKDGQLFITGRIKEIIVLNGKKYNPLDIELLSYSLIGFPSAAFMTLENGIEKIILVQEYLLEDIKEKDIISSECLRLRKLIFKQHGISIHEIIMLPIGSIPKTNSGKIQRSKCPLLYPQLKASAIFIYSNDIKNEVDVDLMPLISEATNLDLEKLEHLDLKELILDSINLIRLKAKIKKELNIELSIDEIIEIRDIKDLSRIISNKKNSLDNVKKV